MNFDVGFFTDITKQFLGMLFGMGQVSTTAGQGMMKIVDFFGMLANYCVQLISAGVSFLGGLGS